MYTPIFLSMGPYITNIFFLVYRRNDTRTYIDIVASPLRSTWHIKNMC